MDTIGYIGLGKMGGPVAERIQRAGFPMVVYDLNDAAVAPFVARGARRAASPFEVARSSDVVYTALPTPAAVESVALGPNGILEGIAPDGVLVDISTGGPDLIRRIAAAFRSKGAWAVDAPVSIGQPGAAPGVHEIMVGAEPAVYERLLPIFRAYGDQIIHAGDVGAGCVCKLVHQMIGCGVTQAIAEGLTLGVKAGVDVKTVWESVRRGLVGRMVMLHEQIPATVFKGTYEPTVFTLTLLRKDLGLATALGRQHDVPLPVSALVEQILVEAVNRGWGNGSGYVVTYKLQEEAAGVSLRADGVDPKEAARYLGTNVTGEANKALVRRFYEEVENQGKLDVADELFAADFRDVYNTVAPFPVEGVAGIKKLAATLHENADLSIDVDGLIAEGDMVVAMITSHTTNKRPLMGVAPTGRRFSSKGVEIFRVVDGKLAERHVLIDRVPMLRELGILPA